MNKIRYSQTLLRCTTFYWLLLLNPKGLKYMLWKSFQTQLLLFIALEGYSVNKDCEIYWYLVKHQYIYQRHSCFSVIEMELDRDIVPENLATSRVVEKHCWTWKSNLILVRFWTRYSSKKVCELLFRHVTTFIYCVKHLLHYW